jgi:hypothetical protein
MSTVYADVDNIQAPPPRASRWSVLRSRAYLILLAAQFASLLGDFFNYVAVAWLVLQLTGSNLAVGVVLAAVFRATRAADAARRRGQRPLLAPHLDGRRWPRAGAWSWARSPAWR